MPRQERKKGKPIKKARTSGKKPANKKASKGIRASSTLSKRSTQSNTIERLHTALESAKMGVWEWNILTNQVEWSDNVKEIFGLRNISLNGNFDSYIELIHPDDRQRVRQTIQESLTSKARCSVQHRLVWPDGTVHWIESMGKVKVNAKGEPLSMIGTVQDISERKLVEEEREDWKKRFELISDSAGLVIYDYHIPSGKIIWSGNIEEVLGYKRSEFANIDRWGELIHPNDRAISFALLEKAQDELKAYDVYYQFQKADGTYCYMHDRGFFIADDRGKAMRMLGMMNDVTERRKTEEALRESEQRFRTLQKASFGGIGLHDQGIIIDCNQGLCELTGYSYEELVGSNGLNLITPEWRPYVMEKIREDYDKTYDVEGLRKDGTRYFLEIRGKNLPYGGRNIRVTEFRDITERKKAEEKIVSQNAKLLSLTEDLLRKNNQLEEFTQIVSHNLRSPVGNIVTLLSFFEGAESDTERREYLNLLKESSATMLYMLNDLNEVLKIKQAKNIEKTELRFEKILDNVKTMLNAKISQQEAVITHDFSQAPTVVYPVIYLESIFLNLLDNALKYSSPDRKAKISFTTHINEKGHIILEVKDNGLGIDLERYGHHVFKLRKTFHKHPESRGIGLFMIKNQVEAMGGEIGLTSKENEGSTFFINFNKLQVDA